MILPRPVESLVDPPEKVRLVGHEVHVEVRIDPAKEGVRVPKDFHVASGDAAGFERSHQGLRSPKVARSRCSG